MKLQIKARSNWYYHSNIHKFIFILVLVVFTGCIFPKPLSLKANEEIRPEIHIVKPGLYRIGDQIPITLTIESKSGVSYQLPVLNSPSSGLEIIQKSERKIEKLSNGSRETSYYMFTGWQAGQYTIPSTNLEYTNQAGTQATIMVPSFRINIGTILPKGKSEAELLGLAIRDLKDPLGLPPRYDLLQLFSAVILIVGVASILLYLQLKKMKEKKLLAELESMKVEPAHIIALRRLEALKVSQYLAEGNFKSYYSELCECLREYMENRYQIPALGMTTEEFLAQITTSTYLPQGYQSIVQDFLNQSDLVKFAKQAPAIQEAQQDLLTIEQLVEVTIEDPDPSLALSDAGRVTESLEA